MRALARRPNVSRKLSGLGMPFWGFGFQQRSDPIGYLDLAARWGPYVETVIETFGAQRTMIGSNYPPDAASSGFVPLWNAYKHLTRQASAEEKSALFHDTAARVYRLPLRAR